MGSAISRKKSLTSAACCVIAFAPGHLPAAPDTLDLIQVVAEDESLTQTGEVISEETSGFFSSLTSEKIAASQSSLGELIAHEAGAEVRESGGFGSYSEISLRGAGSEQVMIFLDGLLLNDGAGGGVDLSLLDPAQTSRIDIYRGSTPLQLGKSSFGGAVNLISYDQSENAGKRATLTAGSFGTRKLSALIRGKRDKNDGLLSFSTAHSDNDFKFTNDNGTQFNPDDDETQRRNHAGVTRHTALLKAGRDLRENKRIDASLLLLDKSQEIPVWNNSPLADAEFDTQSWQARAKLISDGHFDQSLNSSAEIYFQSKKETYNDENSTIGLGAQYDRYTADTSGVRSYSEWLGDSFTGGLNLELREEKYRRDDLLGFDPDDTSRRTAFFSTLQLNRFFLEDDSLMLSPSVRYQFFKNRYRINEASERESHSEGHTGVQLGLKYNYNSDITLKSNAGSYSREPGFYELFGDRGLFLGNDELVSETGLNTDIGIEWNTQPENSRLNNIKIQASAWYNTIDDMIARTYDARGVGKSQNIASARLSGLESSVQLHFKNAVRLEANLTVQNPENRSTNAAFKGKVLPGRNQRRFYSSLSAPVGDWKLLYEFEAQSGRFYDTANLLEAADRELHHLRLARSFSYGLKISLQLNNLTDKVYEDFNGYPRPGRAWYFSLSYEN